MLVPQPWHGCSWWGGVFSREKGPLFTPVRKLWVGLLPAIWAGSATLEDSASSSHFQVGSSDLLVQTFTSFSLSGAWKI